MKKTLVIINEPFTEMVLGKNTTLAYILACANLSDEVYIHNLPENGKIISNNISESVAVFHLDKKDAAKLATKFRQKNLEIVNLSVGKNYEKLITLKDEKVGDFLQKNCLVNLFLPLSEVDFIIQRLEPMKAPFPPLGKENINLVLQQLKKLFPKFIFNCPIDLHDKEIPQEINHILKKSIATPTSQFRLDDEDFSLAINAMTKKYHSIFGKKKNKKIVIKPKNSAQSLGVFALEFTDSGFDLEKLKSQKISTLLNAQIYKIKNKLKTDEIKKIVTILCYIQRIKDQKIIAEKLVNQINETTILKTAKELYNEEILVQPFLEGIKSGDIRANFLKNDQGDFYCLGYTFRSSFYEETSDDFTTCYSAGKAVSKPISILSAAEKNTLLKQSKMIIEVLNLQLRQKYKNVVELGADFILVGDGNSVMLGEINHHCPALIPISEAMGKVDNESAFYDGGLGFAIKAIKDISKIR